VGAERLGLLHLLGHHLEPGLSLQQAEELRGDVVLHLPPAGSPGVGVRASAGRWVQRPRPLQRPRAVRGGEVVAVLGAVLEGGQLGHVREVPLSRPRRRQDGEQPLEVVGEDLGGHRAQGLGSETGGSPPEVAPETPARWPDLVVVDGDVELVVELEGLAPEHAAAPEGVAGIPALRLGRHVQDVLAAGQRPHALPCAVPGA